MRTIVISDLHLTDRFIPKKFDFLQKLISSCDRLIINGDLWCASSTTFDKFLASGWNKLFPLMLSKQTVYISGNHDHHDFIDTRFQQFAVNIEKSLHLKNDYQGFIITHGHQFVRLTNKKSVNVQKAIKYHKLNRLYFTPANNITTRMLTFKFIRKLLTYYNRLLLKRAQKFFNQNAVYVFGHTHLPEYRPDRGYVNTGFVNSGHAWYLEISDFSYNLLSARY